MLTLQNISNIFNIINTNSEHSQMARPMAPVPLPVMQANEVHQQLGEMTQRLTNNPDIVRFSLQVDNRTGMVSANVQHR
ncbi:MAG: hypothetical protein CME74_04155, partial [Halomonas sp.]|nr:hypothetical protein [Halomonas sp.]